MSLSSIDTTDTLPQGRTKLNANFASFAAKHRTTDQTSSGPAVADDTLKVSMAANEVWHFHGMLLVTGGGQLKFAGPSGCDGSVCWLGDGGMSGNGPLLTTLGGTVNLSSTSVINVCGVVTNGATPGDFGLYLADGDSSATVQTGSGLVFRRE